MSEQAPAKKLRREQRKEDEEKDQRWLMLFNKLKEAGFSPKIAAYGATAAVFGATVAALLFV